MDFDGETKITPFNMKDELEEGYFDGSGMYIWNKKSDGEVKDSWLDSIDWMTVKPKGKPKPDEDDDEDMPEKKVDVLELYQQMLGFLKPGENVLKAIKRLGGTGSKKQLSASERLKQKKEAAKRNNTEDTEASTSAEKPEGPDNVVKLTEIADTILSATGNMDIYQETFESVTFKIKRENSKKITTAVNDDDDMFGDGFTAKADDTPDTKEESSGATGSISDASDEVKWEFKWEDKEEAPVYGPHTSSEMNAWVTEGYFKDGVVVRKYKQDGPFYSSKRIDFELYC